MTNQKKRNRFIFRVIVLFILFAAVAFVLISSFLNEDSGVLKEGDVAPNFSLEQVNGEGAIVLHEDYAGKGVMLNFWATYCEPCKDEMPYMEDLYPIYKEKGVEILAVSLDSTQIVIDRFIDNYGLTFPIVHDKRGQVMELYNIVPIPTTYFINPDGTIERIVKDQLTLSKLENYLDEITPE
ncbi:thiol-disulfide oxidoreductase ResA [Salirhabdus salicampi]|uniref:thiol-disulfide oxidoreductase ResA n=1 Tax=Salirhabdus salicampi TaxID=476102 RepID=UPI00346353A1